MDEFKTGDVVQLKSGGPNMTVHSIAGTSDTDKITSFFKGAVAGDIECKWFENGRIESAHFKAAMLKKVEETL